MEKRGKLLLKILAVVAYFIEDARELAASELLPQQSPLDKALEQIVEKIDKTEKTCEKLMIYR